jgi:hypothetical protein
MKARELPLYEPNDKIPLKIGFCEHMEEPSYIAFRLHVTAKNCPSGIDQDLIQDGLNIKVMLYAKNFPVEALTPGMISDVYNDDGTTCDPDTRPPYIVRHTPKFSEMRGLVRKFTVNFDNTKHTMVSHNLFNDFDLWDESTDRAVGALRAIFERDAVQFNVYIRDEYKNRLKDSAKNTFRLLRREIEEGNIFRHFYTQRLQKSDDPHNIDTGTSLKPKADRPSMTTYPPTSFSTVFEMTTRLSVAVMEGLEDTQAKVLELNAKVATIRVLEALGAGDAEYFGFLFVTTEFRIMPRDTLHINFRLENNITDEDWEFVVLKPFNWCLQGEIVGVLKRPRKLILPDAPTAEKTKFRPY